MDARGREGSSLEAVQNKEEERKCSGVPSFRGAVEFVPYKVYCLLAPAAGAFKSVGILC